MNIKINSDTVNSYSSNINLADDVKCNLNLNTQSSNDAVNKMWQEDCGELNSTPERLLSKAVKVRKAREEIYGNPVADFSRIAGMLNALGFRREKPNGEIENITMSHYPLIMLCVKLSRLANSEHCWHEDSYLDIAGYVDCADTLHMALRESTY